MRLYTMGRLQAEGTPGDLATYVLSIRSPGNEVAALQPGFGGYLYVALSDSDGLLTPYELRLITDFVRTAQTRAQSLIVHCEMGISRSVGIARAIAEVLGLEYDSPHYGNVTLKLAVRDALRAALSQEG